MSEEIESASNSPANPTPNFSNPGTPRSDAGVEMRNTPPPPPQSGARPLSMTPQQQQLLIQHQQQFQALQNQSKYSQLLAVIEDMGRDIRPTYSGSRTSAERLKRDHMNQDNMAEVESSQIETVQTIDVEYSADSVEWCGLQNYQDLLLCGTYQLQDNKPEEEGESSLPQVRIGRLYMYQLQHDDDVPQLKELCTVDMPGILDIKWSHQPVDNKPFFGLVNSVGQVKIFSVEDESVSMVTETSKNEFLGLSLEWNNMISQSEQSKLIVSDSAGQLHLYSLHGSDLVLENTWTAHEFEAWIAAFDQWNPNIVLSGGDDCRLKKWDMRTGTSCPVLSSKRHTMGVCSIQSNPVKEHILATGSYDEQLLIWDTRSMKQPLAETQLGGGIWRIKWKPDNASHILSATMYNGFHIVDSSNFNEAALNICCNYTEHKSIAYGADWCRRGCDGEKVTIATCSFYDHILKLWNFSEIKE